MQSLESSQEETLEASGVKVIVRLGGREGLDGASWSV